MKKELPMKKRLMKDSIQYDQKLAEKQKMIST